MPLSPREACLRAARDADLFVLLLGPTYGALLPSGLSATHEEYRAARGETPVLAFVHEGGDREPQQDEFIQEVRDWAEGHYTRTFSDTRDLHAKAVQDLHKHLVAEAALSSDAPAALDRASELLDGALDGSAGVAASAYGNGTLVVAVATDAADHDVVRPSQLRDHDLNAYLAQVATGADTAVLESEDGPAPAAVSGDAVVFQQRHGGAFQLHRDGSIASVQPLGMNRSFSDGLPAIIEEDVRRRIGSALRFTAEVIGHIDPQQRIRRVVPIAVLAGGQHLPWRTAAEQSASPNSSYLRFGGPDRLTARLSPAAISRAALRREAKELAEDLTALLGHQARESV